MDYYCSIKPVYLFQTNCKPWEKNCNLFLLRSTYGVYLFDVSTGVISKVLALTDSNTKYLSECMQVEVDQKLKELRVIVAAGVLTRVSNTILDRKNKIIEISIPFE